MTKVELTEKVAAAAEIDKKKAGAAINAIVQTITEVLVEKDKLIIPGFGTFETRERAARVGRNPATGEEIKIPASIVPAFKPSKVLKEQVNK